MNPVSSLVAMLLTGAAVAGPLNVQAADNAGSAAGTRKNTMCIGCHGIPGYKTAFPEVYHVPRLGGQHAAYIQKALQEYKAGNRSHPTMRAIAAGLTEQDMAELAAYYGVQAPAAAAK